MMRYALSTASLCFAIAFSSWACVPGAAVGQERPGPEALRLTERMVEVDGHAMRVATAGLATRRPGEPVVVFENGATAPLDAWGDVPAHVAAFAPVVAYDRSTIGQSEWDGEIGTPSHVTARLWALLRAMEVEPPYVLVGWSWGGDLIRYHAGTHPGDVAGLVHVDPAGHSPAAALAVLRAIGLGEEAYAADVAAMNGALPSIPPALQADVKAINELYANRTEPEYGPVPPVPTAVLLAGKRRPLSRQELEAFGEPPYDMQVHFQAKLREKIRRLSEWSLSTPEGLLLLVRNSGHAMQSDVPELVIDAIRRVVIPDPALQLLATIDSDGITALADGWESLKRRYPAERIDESVLNRLGYDLLGQERTDEAVAVFELNVRERPDAWNPHDSLGDAYHAAGETEKAIASYRRSLELNPDSPSAAKLQRLEGR
jgi:pimeloyl-ACP methyl ester carboxylesterase